MRRTTGTNGTSRADGTTGTAAGAAASGPEAVLGAAARRRGRRRRRRRRVRGARRRGPASAAGCFPAGGADVPEATASGEVVVRGHGWGHSLGMSQYGAQGATRLGCSGGDILRTYYPGLKPGSAPMAGLVLVDMLTAGGTAGWATLLAETDPVTWAVGDTRVDQPAGSTWSVRRSGDGIRVLKGTSTTSTTAFTAGPGVEVRAYHPGETVRVRTYTTATALRFDRRASQDWTRFRGSTAGLEVREVMADNSRGLAVSKYLHGLAEMPLSWETTTHAVQVVAARSYLLGKFSTAEQGYVILPSPAHQNWLGATQEEEDLRYGSHLRSAVTATTSGSSGTVMVDSSGRLARDLLYTSSHGGWSESNAYVYGTPAVSHLRQVDDSRWDLASANPYRSWAAGLSYAQVASAFGFSVVTSITVPPQGDPDRTAVLVTGTRGGVSGTFRYSGSAARTALQRLAPAVRSPGMTFVRSGAGHPLVGDWDGDGRDEPGWYADGRVALAGPDGAVTSYTFGGPGHVPVVGDFDRDGRDSVGTFAAGTWRLRNARSTGPADLTFAFGRAGDTPVVGRWPGQSGPGVGVVRGTSWFLRSALSGGAATSVFSLGRTGDRPMVGDWDGNGSDTPAVRRGVYRYLSDVVPPTVVSPPFGYGRTTDLHVAGDWDGNGSDTPGVVRGSTLFRSDARTGVPATTSVAVPR